MMGGGVDATAALATTELLQRRTVRLLLYLRHVFDNFRLCSFLALRHLISSSFILRKSTLPAATLLFLSIFCSLLRFVSTQLTQLVSFSLSDGLNGWMADGTRRNCPFALSCRRPQREGAVAAAAAQEAEAAAAETQFAAAVAASWLEDPGAAAAGGQRCASREELKEEVGVH